MVSKEEVMLIFGEYGQVHKISKPIKLRLDLLTVNSELRPCQFGKQFVSSLHKKIEATHRQSFLPTKNIIAVLTLSKNISTFMEQKL